MNTSLTLNFDIPSDCIFDLETIKAKLTEFAKILVAPTKTTYNDYESIMLQKKVQPYTLEELNSRLDRAEKNFAEGRGIPTEDVEKEMLDYVNSL